MLCGNRLHWWCVWMSAKGHRTNISGVPRRAIWQCQYGNVALQIQLKHKDIIQLNYCNCFLVSTAEGSCSISTGPHPSIKCWDKLWQWGGGATIQIIYHSFVLYGRADQFLFISVLQLQFTDVSVHWRNIMAPIICWSCQFSNQFPLADPYR